MEPMLLATTLRSWRDRIGPEAVGLPAGPRRRAPGLRRQELATLAGLSVEYLARLEQGRATSPSASVLGPLARALRLTDAERDHLYRLAGRATPVGPRDHVTPGVQRVIDRLGDVPVMVSDVTWDCVMANDRAVALLGDVVGTNALRKHFGPEGTAATRTHHEPDESAFERDAVADLREALGRYPDDPRLPRLVADLRAASERFAHLWDRGEVGPRVGSRKTIVHPEVGPIAIDCDVLHPAGTSLRLVVYTAEPGSDAARALDLVATIGHQRFAAADGD